METINKNEKIEEMNLIALRKYACPKVNTQKEWYLMCIECPSLDDCRVGKRAITLLERQTSNNHNTIPALQKRMDDHYEHVRAIVKDAYTVMDILRNVLNIDGDIKCSTLGYRLYDWSNKYPDIVGGHPIREAARISLGQKYWKDHSDMKISELLRLLEKEEPETEVSIEDFLKEVAGPIIVEPVLKEKTSSEPKITPSETQSQLKSIFGAKRADIRKQMKLIEEQISELSKAHSELNEQIANLDKVALMFGMLPSKRTESA